MAAFLETAIPMDSHKLLGCDPISFDYRPSEADDLEKAFLTFQSSGKSVLLVTHRGRYTIWERPPIPQASWWQQNFHTRRQPATA